MKLNSYKEIPKLFQNRAVYHILLNVWVYENETEGSLKIIINKNQPYVDKECRMRTEMRR